MTTKPLRVGIAGAGQAGMRHAAGFLAHDDTVLVGIADVQDDRRAAAAATTGRPAVADWQELLAEDLDILVVALPHAMHVAPVVAAAAAGTNVLLEKPIATRLDDARTIVEACESNGVRLGVSFVHRFREEVQRARAWMAAVGRPMFARESMPSERTATHPRWLSDQTLSGGGVLMYGAIHGIDRLRWLLHADVVSVDARTARFPGTEGIEDAVAVVLDFDNGAVATLSSAAPTYPVGHGAWETDLYGETGLVRVRTGTWSDVSGSGISQRYDVPEVTRTGTPYYHFTRQAKDFADSVRHGHAPSVTGLDGLRALECCMAIYRSASERRPVDLAEVTAA